MKTGFLAAVAALALIAAPAYARYTGPNPNHGEHSNPTASGNAGGAYGTGPFAHCPPGGTVTNAPQSPTIAQCPPYSGSSALGGTGTDSSTAGTGHGPQPAAPPSR